MIDCMQETSGYGSYADYESMMVYKEIIKEVHSMYNLGGKKVCDIGGLTGLYAHEMQTYGARVLYVDNDIRATEWALTQGTPERWKVPFLFADVGHPFRFLPGQFDLVTCLQVLEHLPEDHVSTALLNIKDLLVEEGSLCLSVAPLNATSDPTHITLKEPRWWFNKCVAAGLYLSPGRQVPQLFHKLGWTTFLLRKLT